MRSEHKKINELSEISKSIGYFGKSFSKYGFGNCKLEGARHLEVIMPRDSIIILPNGEKHTLIEDSVFWGTTYRTGYGPEDGRLTIMRNQKKEDVPIPFAFIDSFSRERLILDEDFYIITRPLPEEVKNNLRPQIQYFVQQYKQGLTDLPKRKGRYFRREGDYDLDKEQAFAISDQFQKAVVVAEGLGNIHQEELIGFIRASVKYLNKFYRRFNFGIPSSLFWNVLPYNTTLADTADKKGLEQLSSFVLDDRVRQELLEQLKHDIGLMEQNYIYWPAESAKRSAKYWAKVDMENEKKRKFKNPKI